jgi:hypothetical protein
MTITVRQEKPGYVAETTWPMPVLPDGYINCEYIVRDPDGQDKISFNTLAAAIRYVSRFGPYSCELRAICYRSWIDDPSEWGLELDTALVARFDAGAGEWRKWESA